MREKDYENKVKKMKKMMDQDVENYMHRNTSRLEEKQVILDEDYVEDI